VVIIWWLCYVSLVVNSVVGIDVGIKDVVVTSEGMASGNPRNTAKHAARLAKYQKRLARKQKGSNNRRKAKLKVARVHAKIADRRRDFTHNLTTTLIRENQVICVENLAVKNMVKNPTLAKSINDANWGELVRQLEYKAGWYGRTVVAIDRWFPSSKRCSCCGYTIDKLDLATRQWACPECNTLHDRDVNAARNIKAAGLAVLACGETVNPVVAKAAIGSTQ
jgi:putative transposase